MISINYKFLKNNLKITICTEFKKKHKESVLTINKYIFDTVHKKIYIFDTTINKYIKRKKIVLLIRKKKQLFIIIIIVKKIGK